MPVITNAVLQYEALYNISNSIQKGDEFFYPHPSITGRWSQSQEQFLFAVRVRVKRYTRRFLVEVPIRD